MSWIKDLDDDLVNLDHAKSIDVSEVDGEPSPSETHCLVARFPSDDARILDVGTEGEMRNKQALISSKLPMVKLV